VPERGGCSFRIASRRPSESPVGIVVRPHARHLPETEGGLPDRCKRSTIDTGINEKTRIRQSRYIFHLDQCGVGESRPASNLDANRPVGSSSYRPPRRIRSSIDRYPRPTPLSGRNGPHLWDDPRSDVVHTWQSRPGVVVQPGLLSGGPGNGCPAIEGVLRIHDRSVAHRIRSLATLALGGPHPLRSGVEHPSAGQCRCARSQSRGISPGVAGRVEAAVGHVVFLSGESASPLLVASVASSRWPNEENRFLHWSFPFRILPKHHARVRRLKAIALDLRAARRPRVLEDHAQDRTSSTKSTRPEEGSNSGGEGVSIHTGVTSWWSRCVRRNGAGWEWVPSQRLADSRVHRSSVGARVPIHQRSLGECFLAGPAPTRWVLMGSCFSVPHLSLTTTRSSG